ncbi:MAG TPA: hypothetical protein VNJ01_14165 [Bacteriovoracaceae bacterium]|nr:hypothetical protein [Bacteriovoracaceae bacterium]
MKLAVTCMLALSTSLSAFATQPLIIKTNFPGYTMDEDRIIETCEVHPNFVAIKKTYSNGFEFVSNVPSIFHGNIKQLIEEAAKAKLIVSDNSWCDGATTDITAYTDAQGENRTEFSLFNTGSCGNKGNERRGVAAKALIDIVSTHCPTVHQARQITIQ